jgi:histone deacetylase 1/2
MHIVEVGISLLSHASMPLKIWDETFSTEVYLINRLPRKVIGSQSPLERLFKTKPDHSFLCVFGCAVWPNLHPYNARKLEFLSKQCSFVDYISLHKSYKCLDISNRRVYISRDVVFDESIG